MSIRILHVHVHPHALSATVASPNDEDSWRDREGYREPEREGAYRLRQERGHTQCGVWVCAIGNKELVESLALNLILISPEWLGLFSPAFYLVFVVLFFYQFVFVFVLLFLFFSSGWLPWPCFYLFILPLSTNKAANKCKATTYDFFT